jgi:hypothetical protein
MKKIILIFFCAVAFEGAAQITFQRLYDNSGADKAIAVLQTYDGGYAMLCQTVISGSHFNTIIRTDASGNTQWTIKLPDMFGVAAYSFRQARDSGFIMSGSVNSPAGGRGFIMKMSSTGVMQWNKIHSGLNTSYSPFFSSIRQTADGGYIIAGRIDSVNFRMCYRLTKVDAGGNLLWAKNYGPYMIDYYHDIEICSEGGFIMSGTSWADTAAILIKTDTSGNVIWSKYFAVGPDLRNRAFRVIQNPDSGFVVAGYDKDALNKIFLLKVSNSGNTVWARKLWINQWSYAFDFCKTADDGYIICATARNAANSAWNIYTIKFDVGGAIQWSKTYGDSLQEGQCIVQTNDGGFIMAGPTLGSSTLVSDICVVKTDASGNSNCAEANVTTNDSDITALINTGNITGTVNWPIAVIDSTFTLNNYSVNDSILCLSIGIKEIGRTENNISVYPNPTTHEIKIENAKSNISSVEIFNTLGEKVYDNAEGFRSNAGTSQTNTETINVSKLSSGIYFVRVQTGDGMMAGKFVKE